MRLLVCLMALITLSWGTCNSLQLKTDPKTRSVYQCINGQWKFHGKMIRPREEVPIKATISNKCKNNPDMKGSIVGLFCTDQNYMKVVDCLNTDTAYICTKKGWQVYMIHGGKV